MAMAGRQPDANEPPNANLLGDFETDKSWRSHVLNKGTLSNVVTFLVMVVGFVLSALDVANGMPGRADVVQYLVAFGVFGFAGGITNWLAVEMLFTKIPGIAGSGVILRQFVPIRESIKSMMMQMFFEVEFMRAHISARALELVRDIDVGGRIVRIMSEPEFDAVLQAKIVELSTRPEGQLLQTMAPMFGSIEAMVPMLKPMLVKVASELGSSAAESFDPFEIWTIERLHEQLDDLLKQKLLELTPEMVKDMMEAMMRKHCTWLVVWGNLFGGLIGVGAHYVGYA